jgi:hypothetical protein
MVIRRFLVCVLAVSFLALVASGCGDDVPKIKNTEKPPPTVKKQEPGGPGGGSKPVPE